jgi:hypothetical protein
MRAFASYLAGVLTLVFMLAAGGAWTSIGEQMIPAPLPADASPFPFADEVAAAVATTTPAGPSAPMCEIPRSGSLCTEADYRKTAPMELDPHLLVPHSVTSVEDWRPLVERYFEPRDVDRALAVIRCESGGNPFAANRHSSARGLFQHLGSEWASRAAKAGWQGADIFDPVANVAVGAWLVYEGGGWAHWAASSRCW